MKPSLHFLEDDIHTVEHQLKDSSENEWQKRGEQSALELFHQMAERVPAYKDFLQKNNVSVSSIQTAQDFQSVPTIDKDNYLRKYPRSMLSWNGNFSGQRYTISTTSGSTGEPFYFPRTAFQDNQYARVAELYLRSNFNIQNKMTLYIDGFAMGSWIGGLFTYQAIRNVAESGMYPLSIITPGVLKKEILKAVSNLGHEYEQIIIGGYPPMVKDVIDEGIQSGIDWSAYNVGFVFSAEGFTEEFRDYILESAGNSYIYTGSLNHYGTVDLGTMAHETPVSILIRRLSRNNEYLNEQLFKQEFSQPTFVQYVPELFYFESERNNLICSAWSGYPLFRYNLKDTGGVYSFTEIQQICQQHGIDLQKEITENNISSTIWNLPFVYVHERSDFVVKLYGANIYPATIRKVLQKSAYEKEVTGKFLMKVVFDKNHQQQLHIYIELKKSVDHGDHLVTKCEQDIVAALLDENSEYRSNYTSSPERQKPTIVFLPYEHQDYFKPGGKQKWVEK